MEGRNGQKTPSLLSEWLICASRKPGPSNARVHMSEIEVGGRQEVFLGTMSRGGITVI